MADGEAVVQDAFVLSPAVFVTMEGSVDLDQETIDMEVHVSPELGGNIALLSALANPAAGAVVFITQQLFKDDLRRSNFKSYQALGTWQDFELEELNKNKKEQATQATKEELVERSGDFEGIERRAIEALKIEPLGSEQGEADKNLEE